MRASHCAAIKGDYGLAPFKRRAIELRPIWYRAIVGILLLHIASVSAFAECNWAPQPLPTGLVGQYLLNVDSQFTPTPDYQLPSGASFDTNVMNRSAAEVQARRQQAVDFFLAEYGVDFTSGDIDTSGNVVLVYTMLDPLWQPRVIHSAGEMMPAEKWVFHEARYVMTVLGETVFYGNFGGQEGVYAPFGTTAVFGEWVFESVIPCRDPVSEQRQTRYFHFQSRYPFLPDFFGGAAVDYLVRDSGNQEGRATGSLTLRYLDSGDLHAIAKVIVQFPE